MMYFAGKPRLTAKSPKKGAQPPVPEQQDSVQLNIQKVVPEPAPVSSAESEEEEQEDEATPAPRDPMELDTLTPEEIEARVSAFNIKTTPLMRFDGFARDPKFCKADFCSCWELTLLSQHFHPSVSLWALHILAGHPIEYAGDPLKDMSVQAFLDRFMFKNPKVSSKKKADAAGTTKAARKLMRTYEPPTDRAHAVNSAEFLHKASRNAVAPDELFFYKFFKQKEQLHPKDQDQQKKRRVGEDEDDVEAWDSDASSMSEGEAERAVLEGLEEVEGSKIYDREAASKAEKEEWSYDDMDGSDFDEGSSVEEEGSGGSKKKKKPTEDFDDSDIFGGLSDDEEDGEDEPRLGDEDDEDDDDGFDAALGLGSDDEDANMSDEEALNEMLAEERHLDGVGAGSDEEDDEDMPEEEDEAPSRPGKKKFSKFSRTTFASLDEFQDLLEKSGFGDQPEKNRKWEDKRIHNVQTSEPKFNKRKRPDSGSSQPNKRRKRN
jgi:hypothetical protein